MSPVHVPGGDSLEVRWPAPLLDSGLTIVDLPGLGIVNDSYAQYTNAWLGHAKAIIIVADRAGVADSVVEERHRPLLGSVDLHEAVEPTGGQLVSPGNYWLPVERRGNQNRSHEEAAAVTGLARALTSQGTTLDRRRRYAPPAHPERADRGGPDNADVAMLLVYLSHIGAHLRLASTLCCFA